MKSESNSFEGCLQEAVKAALKTINEHNVHIILPTGDRAIDNDDAWILIGQDDGEPVLRNKKEQRRLEAGLAPGYYEDKKLSEAFEHLEICKLADRLLT